MITRENIGEVLRELRPSTVTTILDREGDYITLELSIFNAGHSVMLQSTHYDEEREKEITDNGNLFCDKDDFIRLFKEQGIDLEY